MASERIRVSTRVRYAKLASVLGPHYDKELHQHIARLCVLFEDLRIEIIALGSDDLGRLNEVPKNASLLYFLRRSIGTLHEFADALRLIENLPEFLAVLARMDVEARQHWKNAIRYFAKHEGTIARVRNHVGGHFGLQAAKHAIQHFNPSASGSIEISLFSDRRGGAKLEFASEIAATALIRNVNGNSSEHRIRRLIRIAFVGYRHAVQAVDCISVFYLWDRFGR